MMTMMTTMLMMKRTMTTTLMMLMMMTIMMMMVLMLMMMMTTTTTMMMIMMVMMTTTTTMMMVTALVKMMMLIMMVVVAVAMVSLPVHNSQHLFPDVLCPPERPGLHEVLEAPGIRELVVLPRVVHGQQRQVVAFWLVELRFLLVGHGLFVLRTKHVKKDASTKARDLSRDVTRL